MLVIKSEPNKELMVIKRESKKELVVNNRFVQSAYSQMIKKWLSLESET